MVRSVLFAAAAAILALLLALRLSDGSAANLVQGWYEPILAACVAVLALLAAVIAVQALRSRERWTPRASRGDLVLAVLVLAPLVAGFAFAPSPLGSSSLDTGDGGGRVFAGNVSESRAAQRNLYQWAYAFANTPPAELLGQEVDLVGFVARPKGGGSPDQFLLARFVVACCVADAKGYTLPVQWPGANAVANDAWVRVVGRVATGADGSLVVLASSVEAVGVPANPYIYP
jgi:uncharacterized repeat protein (TIGR03943 family)